MIEILSEIFRALPMPIFVVKRSNTFTVLGQILALFGGFVAFHKHDVVVILI